jgi:hypothetical protein
LIIPSPLQTSKFEPDNVLTSFTNPTASALSVDVNQEVRSFDVRSDDVKNIVVDVGFLKHVITVLISNHHIDTDVKDLEDIFSYYGNVEVKTQKQYVQKRGSKKRGICSNVDLDDVIDVVSKVVVNGINILKRVPEFVGYIESLGIRF